MEFRKWNSYFPNFLDKNLERIQIVCFEQQDENAIVWGKIHIYYVIILLSLLKYAFHKAQIMHYLIFPGPAQGISFKIMRTEGSLR